MRRIFAFLSFLAAIFMPVSSIAADCSFCGGVALTDGTATVSLPVPLYVAVDGSAEGPITGALASLSPEVRAGTLLIVRTPKFEGDAVTAADAFIARLVDELAGRPPLAAAGIDATANDAQVAAFATKRFAVAMQGRGAANAIAAPRMSLERLGALYDAGAGPYFDEVLVDAENAASIAAWLGEHDPAKRLVALVDPTHANRLYDLAQAFANGATRAYIATPGAGDAESVAAMNRELKGDFAYDATSSVELLRTDGSKSDEKALAFVRGEDLRTVLFTPGNPATAIIVSLPSDDMMSPRRIDARGAATITDVGKKAGRFLVGLQPSKASFLLTADRPPLPDTNVTKEAIDVVTARGISVEEIIRNHQAYWSFQDSIAPRYIAHNETKLRFNIQTGEAFEATLAGEQYFDGDGRSDWVWRDLLINGVKWKYGEIPELPLIQPEKVSQLPLDLHLTNEYRYALAGETQLRGYDTYEVRYEPPPNAPADLPLYRGTVWIDRKTWTRVRISMIQLNLEGEVLSNEETIDYVPFAAGSHELLAAEDALSRDARSLIWLPRQVTGEQVLSMMGRGTAVRRDTDFSAFEIDPASFETRHSAALASRTRMVRDTAKGLRYLVPEGNGQRRVKDEFDTSRLFLAGGVFHDDGMEYPVVPLGGIDYFNFDLGGRGIQTNVFYAGVMAAINATDPSFRGSRTNLGIDFFGIAVPFENTILRDGEDSPGETVATIPVLLNLRAGHPVFGFGKVDVNLGLGYTSYQRADDTAPEFVEPPNTFELRPGVDFRYDRWGNSFTASWERGYRTDWAPWGDPLEYDPDQETYDRYVATVGRSFYLPKFQRIGIELDYMDGRNLDRFSKYELGFFGTQRVRGIASGSVRAERAILGHLSYGFVISDLFRLEAFYDHALIDDSASALERAPFQGVGIAGQTVGPWGTLLRLDIGKSVGPNAQDDFVASVLFLKLFD